MKKITIAIMAFFLIEGVNTKAQQFATATASIPVSLAQFEESPWTVGLGMNVIENNGDRYHQLFRAWNIPPFPSRIVLSHILGYGFSIEGSFGYGHENAGVDVDQGPNTQAEDYYMYDLNFKYNLHSFFDNKKFIIQPFVVWGGGFTYKFPFTTNEGDPHWLGFYHSEGPPYIFRNFHGFGSMNIGLGFDVNLHNIAPNSKVLSHFSLSFQTMGKWTDDASDYVVNSFTILYRLPHKVNKPQLL